MQALHEPSVAAIPVTNDQGREDHPGWQGRERPDCLVGAASTRVYDDLFVDDMTLHDQFGRGGNDVMRRLRALRGGD